MKLYIIYICLFQNQSNLRSTVHSSDVVTVLRGSENYMEKISTEYLVPGDVIVIPSSDYNMNCDAVLLTGNCIVNESMLTGKFTLITPSTFIISGSIK